MMALFGCPWACQWKCWLAGRWVDHVIGWPLFARLSVACHIDFVVAGCNGWGRPMSTAVTWPRPRCACGSLRLQWHLRLLGWRAFCLQTVLQFCRGRTDGEFRRLIMWFRGIVAWLVLWSNALSLHWQWQRQENAVPRCLGDVGVTAERSEAAWLAGLGLFCWLSGWLVVGWQFGWLNGWRVGWVIGERADWAAGWMASGWLVGSRLAGLLAGHLFGGPFVFWPGRLLGCRCEWCALQVWPWWTWTPSALGTWPRPQCARSRPNTPEAAQLAGLAGLAGCSTWLVGRLVLVGCSAG